MDRLNITEYQSESNDYQMYYGKASLRSGYYIANFDERFFHLIGVAKGYLSVPELIHPEDVEVFQDAVSRLDQAPQRLILRILCYNDKYRWFYVVLKYNGKVLDGFRSFDMELCEIMAITDRYKYYVSLVEKYREYMTLFTGMFLEYDYALETIKIYEYVNRQNSGIFEGNLEETYRRVMKDGQLSQNQKAEFQILYEALKSGKNHAKVDIDAAVFLGQASEGRFEIRLSTIYWEGTRERAVGLVSVVSKEQPKKSYYLTDSAFDPGTGVLNKRAIHEYAVEKIQNQTEGLYLAIMDVDDFKQINDRFGHMFGDEVLSKVAEVLQSVVGPRGGIGRFGGDEFMIVFEGIDSEATLRRILSTINRNIEWANSDVEGLKVTTSIGVSKYPEDGTTYEDLFQTADKCVYIGKAKGKNRYIIYDVNKHGAVEKDDSVRLNIGLKANISDAHKNEGVSDLVLQLYREGEKALIPVMKQMQSYFDIDGIALYAGEDMKRIYSVGKYVNPIQSLACVREDSYQGFFDEQGFCEMNRMVILENKAPEAFDLYTKQENGKVIQCALLRDGRPVSIVSFDFFNRYPKTGTTDLGLIKIVGRMMAEVIAGA